MVEIAAYSLLIAPLAGVLLSAAARTDTALRATGIVSAGLAWISALALVGMTFGVMLETRWDVITWMALRKDIAVTAGFLVDSTSAITAFIIASTNLAVHICKSAFETAAFAHRCRHDAVAHLGTFSAMLAVMANNYGMLYLGWEGVALSTWLLVRLQGDTSAAARTLAFQSLGSLGMLSGLVFMLVQGGSGAFVDVFGGSAAGIIVLPLAVAAFARAGLWPLHPWLESVTRLGVPPSAFVQSVFAVPLGLYLIVRSWPLLSAHAAGLAFPLIAVGAIGAMVMAACAAFALDPRRSLAYSTSSQGAVTMALAAMGMPAIALLQLSIHTIGKCVLLMSAGLVERATSSAFELVSLGGLRNHLRTAYRFFFVATIALVLPPFAGFWVLLSFLDGVSVFGPTFVILGGLIVLLTTIHLFRLLFSIFMGTNPSTVIHEQSSTVPQAFIAGLSGLMLVALWISDQASPLRLLAPPRSLSSMGALPEFVQVESILGIACLLLTLVGCGWAWVVAGDSRKRATTGGPHRPSRPLRHLLDRGLLFNGLYTVVIVRPIYWLADRITTIADVGIELLCMRGAGTGIRVCGWLMGSLHDGRFAAAAAIAVLTAAAVLAAVVWLTSR